MRITKPLDVSTAIVLGLLLASLIKLGSNNFKIFIRALLSLIMKPLAKEKRIEQPCSF